MRRNRSVASKLVSSAVVYATLGLTVATNLVAQTSSPQMHRFELRIENGEISNRSKPIQVQRDDSVEIDWSTDQRAIVHLHGYDILVTVIPDKHKK